MLLCVHTQYNPFAHPSHPSCSYYYLLSPIYCFCTSYLFLHILLTYTCTFLYSITHFTLYFYFLLLYNFYSLHCPLSGPDLIYISLLIIPCIIYHVTNKETLDPWIFGRMWVTKELLVHIDSIGNTVDQQLFGFPPSSE